ncbi:hypothetical protein [Novosphingobium percolationis]|uniref:hypothetical protein n=1 Tax=Novosphingobium percolationis TaxID=2871811 RepID=UPI001CD6C77D|nr:hypothetical protein [Novosphingobium percolationis]
MKIIIPELDWSPVIHWQTARLIIPGAGLFRFLLDGSVVFIGYVASPWPGFANRIYAYRRGDDPDHYAAQQISRLKDQLELQIAFLDHSPREIRDIGRELIRRERPTLNPKNPHGGRY